MKTNTSSPARSQKRDLLAICTLTLLALAGLPAVAEPLGTAFTYQGKLTDSGAPAEGMYDFWFKLYDAADGGTQIGVAAVPPTQQVSNGLFTVTLDFGAGAFTNSARWLEVWVRTNNPAANYTFLTPRQELKPTPYALYAPEAGAAATLAGALPATQITGPLPEALLPSGLARLDSNPAFTGAVTAGGNITAGADVAAAGSVLANANVTAGGDLRGVRLLAGADNILGPLALHSSIASGTGNTNLADLSFIGGGDRNFIDDAIHSFIGGGFINRVEVNAAHSVIGGGGGNVIGSGSYYAAIGGGVDNTIAAERTTIAGGSGNKAIGYAAAVGGGEANTAGGEWSFVGGGYANLTGPHAVVGGGYANGASAEGATVAGGQANTASDVNSAVGGGYMNTASGQRSVVGGGETNSAFGLHSAVGGGYMNTASDVESFVGGGYANTASGRHSFVGGGQGNTAGIWGFSGGGRNNRATGICSVVGGGDSNDALEDSSIVAGGQVNTAFAVNSAVGGGYLNKAKGEGSTVPGGLGNEAWGAYSFAAGYEAIAAHDGSFVWADHTEQAFGSTTTNQFAIRAQNGVIIQAQSDRTGLELRGGAIKVTGAGVNTPTAVFVHHAFPESISGHITSIDNPLCNGDPDAILIVTHNYSKDESSSQYETSPVGVWYDSGSQRWTIYHEDFAAMPVGRAFNVMIVKP